MYKPLTTNEVCNLLRSVEPTLKANLKTLAAAKGESMGAYVNSLVAKHIHEVQVELKGG